MIEAYPLYWPEGQARTKFPERSRFGDHTLSKATKEVLLEIERMRATDPIISTNIPLRKDGYPRADYEKRKITDKGVAVYFSYKKRPVVLACDKWESIEDNLWAIACSIAGMRALDRWGVSEILDRAFTGFTAIPERAGGKNCWDVLGLNQTKDKAVIKARYYELAKQFHPDKGGSQEQMTELAQAYEVANNFADQ